MLKRYHRIIGTLFRLTDASVVGLSWIASYWIRFDWQIAPITKGIPRFETYAALTPLIMLLWLFVLSSAGAYQHSRMVRRTDEALTLLRAHLIAVIVFLSLTYLFSEYRYSRVVMVTFGLLSGVGLLSFRALLRNGLRTIRRKGYNLRHVLLVGEGPAIEHLYRRISRFPEIGLRVSGWIRENPHPTIPGSSQLEDIGTTLDTGQYDQVWVSFPTHQSEKMKAALSYIGDRPVVVRVVPDLHEFITLGCEVEDFEGIPIVNLNSTPLEGWGGVLKRGTDLLLSLLALVLLSPLFLLIAILIKLSSKGPVFYSQLRMGLDGRPFQMLKFRSMRTDAEATTGAVWTVENDPRRTRLGSFLRGTSLDELPQLWNVLLGQMSLVGPRPERPVFVNQFRTEIPHYMLRHKVKAGLTGWAQVNGWRGNTSLEKRIECDLFYIKNWSYLLDIKILFLTLWRGFIHKNAY